MQVPSIVMEICEIDMMSDNSETEIVIEFKKCNKCDENKPFDAFETNRATCRQCRYKSKAETAEKKSEEKIQNGEIPNVGNCRTCKLEFNEENKDLFRYRTDYHRYDSICKKCYGNKKYHQTYRDKKRAEDEEEFLKHNAEVHNNYINEHKEIITQNTRKRNTNSSTKLTMLKTSAKTRGIEWKEQDEDEMMKKLTQNCIYCNESVEEADGILRGLDRINNDKGYTNENTAPCCHVCNMMKGTFNIETFLYKINKIAENNLVNNISNNIVQITIQNESNNEQNETKEENIKLTPKPKKKRMIHHPELQGIRISFINKDTGVVAHIVNTIKEAGELIGITNPSSYMKLKNIDAIWVKPYWTAREWHETDELNNEENQRFMIALNEQMNKDSLKNKRIKYKFYLQKTDGTKIQYNSIVQLAKALNIPERSLNRMLNQANYKTQNVEIVIAGFKVSSVLL